MTSGVIDSFVENMDANSYHLKGLWVDHVY